MVKVRFLGASGTVTGSKYLISSGRTQILVDAGLFQGPREWSEKNWDPTPFNHTEITAVLLTHAHLDHTGILPRYYSQGLRCPIYATPPTIELCKILLPDSGQIQEERTEYVAKKGYSRHHPPLPLYTAKEAQECVKLIKPVPYSKEISISEDATASWSHMGHIIGAASINLRIGGKHITFSGDIGRYTVPILKDPTPSNFGDLLLVESTYGDRLHGEVSPREALKEVVAKTISRKGVVLVPSFAVGRTQLLLYYLHELKEQQQIPDIPVIIDSPMAKDATFIYERYASEYDETMLSLLKDGKEPFRAGKTYFIKDREESIKLNSINEPMIIISASGMLTGGRILHHIRHRISSPLNTLLFVGYQPEGSKGAWIKSGAETVRIFGEEIPVRAQIAEITGLSAHGDQAELVRWCKESTGTPGRVAVVHGEPSAAAVFKKTLENEFGWNVFLPKYGEEIEI